jgi:hypothetical protein
MNTSLWVQAAVFGLVLVQVYVFWQLYRESQASSIGNGGGERFLGSSEGGVDARPGQVVCSDCGAPNDVGYRYCQHCVSELPGHAP